MFVVDVFHNILWSRYKGVVFSKIAEQAADRRLKFQFHQIAETELDRVSLSVVDLSYHKYPYEVLFAGAYSTIPLPLRVTTLFKRVWNSKADLVVLPCYDRIEYWGMLAAAILRGKKRAVFSDSTIHDRPQVAWKGWLKRLFLSTCDGVFVYGQRARQYAIHYGAPPAAVFSRCQAAALPHDYSRINALAARVASAPSPNAPRYLYVGRMSPEKSLDSLLYAFAEVVGNCPDAKLALVGSGPDQLKLEAISASLELASSVLFLGSMNTIELAKEYSRATCLVLPSKSEPWGLVVNEALSYGCPVVVSDACGCVPELVIEGITGFAFKVGDVADLQAKLSAVTMSLSDVSSVANSCLATINRFTPAIAASQIIDGCQEILSR
ncbi:glycosyltransferase family 4 protein [Cognatiluteimonas profundi]|uniref:glycosyltransferase family 4 protein n=1 Tax=Cognatiluteimonas profundi TaxID=2594501 RepID=UPI001E5F7583|nr:glycosyltransferase [Lysobacter profundi]